MRTRILGFLLFCVGPAAWAAPFSFGAWGDLPYFAGEEPRVERLIADMNRESLAFVVHVGDIKPSWTNCSDELFASRAAPFASHRHPFALLPGDNAWTDCYTGAAGRHDPIERLQKLRALFYPAFKAAPFAVESHAAMPENMLWRIAGVQCASLNITGSNDNLGRNAEMDDEHHARRKINLDWLDRAFRDAAATRAKALVLLIHANPAFERTRPPVRTIRRDGYAAVRERLALRTRELGRPVLVVHGDTHTYRFDKPLHDASGARIENLYRLEVFGSPAVNWVKITIDPDAPTGEAMFRVQSGVSSPFTE